jgi:hypothetical protein
MTNFTIVINTFEDGNFEGFVNDDITTGGMKEMGIIIGNISGNMIKFKKYMPQESLIDVNGNHFYTGKKHKTLYYSGELSADKTQIKGKWKFNYSIAFLFGVLPIPFRPGTGTWGMTYKARE